MLELPRNNVLITSYIVAVGVQLNYYLTATISHFLEKDARKKSSEFRPQMFLTELGLIKLNLPIWLWTGTIFLTPTWSNCSPLSQLWAIGRDHVNNIKVVWRRNLSHLKVEYKIKFTFFTILCHDHNWNTLLAPRVLSEYLQGVSKKLSFTQLSICRTCRLDFPLAMVPLSLKNVFLVASYKDQVSLSHV